MFDDEGATGTAADGLRAPHRHGLGPDDIAMTNGGWGAIAVGIRALVEPGDEVIYYDPPWFFYDLLIRGAEATPVTLRLEPPRFSPDPAALAAAITPGTRAVLLNTPHNPTGRILDDAELDAVAEVLRAASDRHGRPIYLLSDEAYRLIALDGRRAPSPAEHYERTLVLYSYGKQLLAPGQRIGYLALSPRIPSRGAGDAARGGPDRAVRQQLLVAERAAPARAAGHRGPRARHRRPRAAARPPRAGARRAGVRADDPRGHVLRPRPQPDRGRQGVRRTARRRTTCSCCRARRSTCRAGSGSRSPRATR